MNYDASINYLQRPTVSEKSKRIGATLLGGIAGMTCYYLPISKDTFVNEAYRVTKKNAENDIKALNLAADELSKNKLSNETKILLHRMGIAENIDAIKDKCKNLRESVTEQQL